MKKLIFVCTGNICRSPFAEHWAKKQLSYYENHHGKNNLDVCSFGTHALKGYPPPKEAIIASEYFKVSTIAEHRARQVDAEYLLDSNLVFTMSIEQKNIILDWFPELKQENIYVLADFSAGIIKHSSIPDPYGCEIWAYRACYSFICECVDNVINQFKIK